MNYVLTVAGICGLGTLQAHLTVGCWPVVGVRKWVPANRGLAIRSGWDAESLLQ